MYRSTEGVSRELWMTTQMPRSLAWVDSSHALLGAVLQPQSLPSSSPLAGKGQNPSSSSGSFSTPESLGSWPLLLAFLFLLSGGSKASGRGLSGVGPRGGSCPAPLQPQNPPPESQLSANRRGHLAASTRQVCTPNLGKRTPKPDSNGIQIQIPRPKPALCPLP